MIIPDFTNADCPNCKDGIDTDCNRPACNHVLQEVLLKFSQLNELDRSTDLPRVDVLKYVDATKGMGKTQYSHLDLYEMSDYQLSMIACGDKFKIVTDNEREKKELWEHTGGEWVWCNISAPLSFSDEEAWENMAPMPASDLNYAMTLLEEFATCDDDRCYSIVSDAIESNVLFRSKEGETVIATVDGKQSAALPKAITIAYIVWGQSQQEAK